MQEESRNNPPVLVARRDMSVDGQTRQYLISMPVDYDPAASYSLVFGFHGLGGDREQLRRYMNIEPPTNGRAIVVYPSSGVLDDGRVGWNSSDQSNDMAFVDALLAKYTQELCIDEARIFATGHSFGGCMSNTVGCLRGDVFRAIAPIAGCGPSRRTDCVGQVASLQIHSPKDTSTSYSGAIQACTRYLRANGCEEMPECGCHWVDELDTQENECVQQAQETYDPGVPVDVTERDERDPIFRRYIGCDADYPVLFADHWWRERAPDDTREERWHNPPPWSPRVIWHFFDQLGPPGSP